jgi:hypothetical protein
MAALTQTAANVVSGSGTVRKTTGVAGGTITAGMPVYKDLTDTSKLKAARANAAVTAVCAGIALTGSASGQPIVYQSTGNINLGATLAVGETYVVSDAVAGQIVPIGDLGSGDFVCILGVATSTSILALDIHVAGVAKA